MKGEFKGLLKEIISITIGILIALYINNWNEDRKDSNYIENISASIHQELYETREDIDKKIVQQRMLIDTLNFYRKNDQMSLDKVISKAKGIFIPSIRINSWKAIANSKIELMDYSTVSTLADIEEQKELLKIKSEKLLDYLFANYRKTGEEQKEFMQILMSEIISTETFLKQSIDEIIKEDKSLEK
ncbi:hypothetical protein [Aquimarina sp. 433]